MAKVLFGNGVSQIAGSIAGNTYSRNRYGAYIRNRVAPVNPRTPAQTGVRLQFGALSSQWRSLSSADQAAWVARALEITSSSRPGYPQNITGSSLFLGFNLDQISLGNSPIDAPPILDSAAALAGLVLSADTAPAEVLTLLSNVLSGGPTPILIYATPALSAGRYFVSPSQFRLLEAASTDDIDATAYPILTPWEAQFGNLTPQAGAAIFAKVTVLSTNGWRNGSYEARAVVL